MTISRIADLFAANIDSVQRTKARKSAYATETNQQQTPATTGNTDAVKVSTSGSQSVSNAPDDRAARLASLKNQVQSGSYKPDGAKVAQSLFVDLF